LRASIAARAAARAQGADHQVGLGEVRVLGLHRRLHLRLQPVVAADEAVAERADDADRREAWSRIFLASAGIRMGIGNWLLMPG
jgi:hypothetical protein